MPVQALLGRLCKLGRLYRLLLDRLCGRLLLLVWFRIRCILLLCRCGFLRRLLCRSGRLSLPMRLMRDRVQVRLHHRRLCRLALSYRLLPGRLCGLLLLPVWFRIRCILLLCRCGFLHRLLCRSGRLLLPMRQSCDRVPVRLQNHRLCRLVVLRRLLPVPVCGQVVQSELC